MTTTRSRLVPRTVVAAGVLPATIAVAGAVLIRGWRDELPASVATHWGLNGTPDDFAGPVAVALFVGGFGVVAAAVGAVLAVLAHRDGLLGRSVAAVTAGTTAFVTVLTTSLVADQRGLADAGEAGIGPVPIVGSLAAAVIVAAVAGWMVPPGSERPASGLPADAPRLQVESDERVVWTRSVATGSYGVVVLVAGVGVTVVSSLLARQWWLLGLAAALAVLAVLMYSVTVTVDRHGLTVRGRFGWPRLRTPIEQVDHAAVAEVHPIRHFGGYGYRVAAFGPLRGASGFILRGGPGLVLDRADGGRTVVVVEDAETAAGLLNTLADRARS